ncbi:hypothetical protein FCV25MIE_09519 [Fagus crenata]
MVWWCRDKLRASSEVVVTRYDASKGEWCLEIQERGRHDVVTGFAKSSWQCEGGSRSMLGACEASNGGVAASTNGGASPIRVKMGLRKSSLRHRVPVGCDVGLRDGLGGYLAGGLMSVACQVLGCWWKVC